MHAARGIRATALKCAVGIAAVASVVSLTYRADFGFTAEWVGNVWFVGYFGESLRDHGSYPVVFNTTAHLGATYPLFYGPLLFEIAGLLSLLFDPHVALRLVLVLATALPYVQVRRALRRLGAAELLATCVACVWVWSTYSLTNLYNRNALPEYVAFGMLSSACCSWFLCAGATTRWGVIREGLYFGLFLALAGGSHAITGMLSVPVICTLALATLPVMLRRELRTTRLVVLAAAATGAALTLAPWLYVYHRFGAEVLISGGFSRDVHTPESLHLLWVRLFPLPFDLRCHQLGHENVFPPYIDTQVNLPLFVFAAGVVCAVVARLGGRGRVALLLMLAVPVLLCAGALALSVSPALVRWAPDALCKVQFGYRFVSVVNLAVLSCLLVALSHSRAQPSTSCVGLPAVLCAIVMALAVVGLIVKLNHALAIPLHPPLPKSRHDLRAWATHLEFPNSNAYLTPRWLAPLTADEQARLVPADFEVDWHRSFGQALPMSVTLERNGYCATRVMPFPWARFWVDGKEVPPDRLRTYLASPAGASPDDGAARVAVPMSAGTHVLQYQFTPDRTWRRLDRASRWLLSAWLILAGASWLLPRRRRRARAAGCAPLDAARAA